MNKENEYFIKGYEAFFLKEKCTYENEQYIFDWKRGFESAKKTREWMR